MARNAHAAFRRQLTQLYSQQAYAQALDLLNREPYHFQPPGMLYHWKMCLAARANDPLQAIQAFRTALESGYSYPAALIREDEDLASLQGMPEYEQLAALSQQRFAEAEGECAPELLLTPPEGTSGKRMPLLLGLHGNSQNARLAAKDWHPLLARGWLVACAQSSQLLTSDAYIWNDLARGSAEVQHLFGLLNSTQAIDFAQIVLGGFSMGGGLAVQMAVTGAINARGFIVVGPYLRDLEPLKPRIERAAAQGVRGYIVMGLQEQPEGQEIMHTIHDFLNTHGVPCELETHPELAHAIPEDFAQSLNKALAFLGAPERAEAAC